MAPLHGSRLLLFRGDQDEHSANCNSHLAGISSYRLWEFWALGIRSKTSVLAGSSGCDGRRAWLRLEPSGEEDAPGYDAASLLREKPAREGGHCMEVEGTIKFLIDDRGLGSVHVHEVTVAHNQSWPDRLCAQRPGKAPWAHVPTSGNSRCSQV
eukprot:CAMPEP_0170587628 /NCGR_PEP_ID=MMETSP0224-20130122/10386_1 /TAXON_ID=285029 /ORGANISM="Togula jolla, Strain CCCM 725" /LENGTH=153 /DNA_ID=CAMNT_0010911267 /DNA_START=413 /DNA_END=874 /DNA_ORIENTATION=+